MSSHREVVEVKQTDFLMPYAPLVKVRAGGTLLFISGATALPLYHQHPHQHDHLDPPDDVREQARLVMENLRQVLEAAGATFADVVRTDVFVTDMDDQDAIGGVMESYFRGDYPASTLVEVNQLVDRRLKLEVNAIAVVDDDR